MGSVIYLWCFHSVRVRQWWLPLASDSGLRGKDESDYAALRQSVRLGIKRRDNYLRHCSLGHTHVSGPSQLPSAHKTGSNKIRLSLLARRLLLRGLLDNNTQNKTVPHLQQTRGGESESKSKSSTPRSNSSCVLTHPHNLSVSSSFGAADKDLPETSQTVDHFAASTDLHRLTEPADPVQSG